MNTFEIMEFWAKGLLDDSEFTAWVEATFDRPITIYLGFDDVGRFGEEDAPYLVMSPCGEEFGPEQETLRFSVMLMFGVKIAGEPGRSENIISEPAMALMEKEFSPRVLDALHRINPDIAPGTGEGRTYPPRNGYCERDFVVTLDIPNTINLKHNPWR